MLKQKIPYGESFYNSLKELDNFIDTLEQYGWKKISMDNFEIILRYNAPIKKGYLQLNIRRYNDGSNSICYHNTHGNTEFNIYLDFPLKVRQLSKLVQYYKKILSIKCPV
jgi:hypothetical protein